MSDTTFVLPILGLMRLVSRQYGSQILRVEMLRSPQYKGVFHAPMSSILPFAHLDVPLTSVRSYIFSDPVLLRLHSKHVGK